MNKTYRFGDVVFALLKHDQLGACMMYKMMGDGKRMY